jgi:hypothetical protein
MKKEWHWVSSGFQLAYNFSFGLSLAVAYY